MARPPRQPELPRLFREGQFVQGQAMALAYIDTYWMLAVGAAIMCCLSLFLKKNVGVTSGPGT